ncbi:hypothetical protein B0H15DRAFT_819946 [Mycena belliarum]|uniref:Uncharacterized protein n=1 Tax=Mycena belliarum TaxID=1033014 RepID=A0AAD6XXB3_9AGAR|nr:hypothetical protein B0H15DRAFT_819946 [Mycena belliae]
MADVSLLVILAQQVLPQNMTPDWNQITNVLRGIYGPINPVAYQTTGDYAAGDRVLGILCSVGSVALDHPQVKFLLKPAFKGEKLDIRMYETIPAGAQILLPTFPGKHLLVLNGMTPNDSAEGTFNDWYAEEHIPMLSAVPGWRSSRRFRLRAASTSPPVYLALHEWDSYDAFGTPEFVAATNTPWRTRVVVEQVDKKERHLMEYLGVLEDLGRRSG